MSKERIGEVLATFYESGGGDPERLIEAHPDLAEALRSHFDALSAMDDAFGALPEGAPKEIGEYRILRELGHGGMGVVYEAEQASMKRRVALKVLSLAVTGTPHAVRRFQREAQAAGRLHHTNIVPVYGLGQHGGYSYYAMELVHGRPLSLVLRDMRGKGQPGEESLARLAAEPQTPRRESATGTGARAYFARVAEMFAGVAEALDLAHREKVIHRDIKPSNLLLDEDGILKIVDFGLARTTEEGPSLTITGDLIGTPVYMSPEQAMAKRMAVDHRTDIYSLGATLYEALALKPPFEGGSLQEICSQIITKDPVLPRRVNAKVPKDLETVVLKAMEKDRDRRYATAGAFARDLRRFAEGGAIQARRIGLAGRAWRKVKRHRVRSALVAAALLLAATAGLFAASAAREARRHAELEYEALCEAVGAFGPATWQMSLRDRWQGEVPLRVPFEPDDRARESLDRAIGLLPGRPEAYLLRALASGRTLEERLADLDTARSRGLDDGTFFRGRAHLLAADGRWEEAAAAEAQAEALPIGTIEARYFAAILFHGRGDRAEARQLLDQAIAETRAGSIIHRLALRSRSRLRAMEGEFGGALDDLMRLEDDSVAVRVEIAALWQRFGKPDEAERRFEEVLAGVEKTDTAAAWVDLCGACTGYRQRSWALRAAEAALAHHDGSAAVRAAYATALVQSGDLVRGREAAERAIHLDPLSREAHMSLGVALRGLGRPDEAVGAFEKAKELRPWSVVVRLWLGDVYQELDRHAEALAEYEDALKLNPRFAKAHIRRGFALNALGKCDEARAAHEDALRLDPDDPEAVMKRGALEALQARFAEALEYFDRAVKLDPKSWDAWHSKGRALGTLGRHDEALTCHDQAIRLAPTEPGPYIARGVIRSSQLHKFQEALDDFDEAIRLARDARDLALAHLNRGATLCKIGQFEEATEAYRCAGDFGDPNGYFRCGHVLLENLQRAEEALEAFSKAKALGLGHADLAQGCFRCGCALMESQPQAALKAFDLVLFFDEKSWEAWDWRGGVLNRLDRHEEALKCHERAMDLAPLEPGPYVNRGLIRCDRLRDFDKALEDFDKAIALDSQLAVAHFNRGVVLRNLEEFETAVKAYRRAGELCSPRGYFWCGRVLLESLRKPEEALKAFDKALEKVKPLDRGDPVRRALAGDLAHGYFECGRLLFEDLRQPQEALEALAKGAELAPDQTRFPGLRGRVLRAMGRHEEALGEYRAVLDLVQDDRGAQEARALILMDIRKYEEALEECGEALAQAPDWPFLHCCRAACLRALDKKDEARRLAAELLKQPPVEPDLITAYLLAVAGRPEEARKVLAGYDPPVDAGTAYHSAKVYAVLGDVDVALRCLEIAVEKGFRLSPGAAAWPDLGADPRFRALLERLR